MLLNHYEILKQHISGSRAKNNIREIDNFHRIPPSKQHREAAFYCMQLLKKEGVKAKVIEHKADGETFYLKQKSVKEWDCQQAFLDLTSPSYQRLCDLKTDPNYLMARSFPVDLRNKPIDLVWLKNGVEEENYPSDLDLKGKMIFISGDRQTAMNWAIAKKGAIGLVSDRIGELNEFRKRADVYDHRGGGSFQWQWDGKDIQTFGFSLSPREGDRLKELCQRVEDEWKKDSTKPRYPQVTPFVDSKLYDGYYDLVEATIEGETKEEILISAHLCHNRSCANDNASGVSGAIEVMRTLQDLIDRKIIAKPKRSIKAILMAECVGTYPYLQENVPNWKRIKATINLDMIGGDQRQDKGTVVYIRTPDGVPSFINELVALIREMNEQDYPSFAPNSYIPLVHTKMIDYMGGSDHTLFNQAHIPSAFICQWPDMTYHTSGDTVDQIDPEVLRKNTLLAATYVLTLANLEEKDVLLITTKMKQSFQEKLSKVMRLALSKDEGVDEIFAKINYYAEVYTRAVLDFKRFFKKEDGMDQLLKADSSYYKKQAKLLFANYLEISKKVWPVNENQMTSDYSSKMVVRNADFIHTRSLTSGFFGKDIKEKYAQLLKKYGEASELADYVLFHIDNQSSVDQLAKKAYYECGIDNTAFVHDFIALLAETKEIILK